MLRKPVGLLVAFLLMAGIALAADKEVKGKIVKVDAAKNKIILKTDDGNKTFDTNDDTKVIGPKGGVSDAGLKDERLVKGAEVTLKVAGNNRTVREIHVPMKKGD